MKGRGKKGGLIQGRGEKKENEKHHAPPRQSILSISSTLILSPSRPRAERGEKGEEKGRGGNFMRRERKEGGRGSRPATASAPM